MEEEQFHPLPSQGNIYSSTQLGSVTILASGDAGKLFTLTSKTTLQELPLLHLPSDIDIVSVDSFQDSFPVVALTYVQKEAGVVEDSLSSYLQIYSSWSPGSFERRKSVSSGSSSSSSSPGLGREEFSSEHLHAICQHSTTIKLDFIPYHLHHALVQRANGTYGTVFLLSGSDHRIHTYESTESESTLTFLEVDTRGYFPELSRPFPHVVTRIGVEIVNELNKRITLCGCEDGSLEVWIVTGVGTPVYCTPPTIAPPPDPEELLEDEEPPPPPPPPPLFGEDIQVQQMTHCFDGLITSIQFFVDGFSVNAVIASAFSPTYIYSNVVEEEMRSGSCLKFSSRWDSVQALCVADIDFDGRAEIVIGTYGCALVVYKYMDEVQQWVIVAYKKLPSAVFSVEFQDSLLYVVSASGLHLIKYTTAPYFKLQNYGSVQSGINTDLSLDSMEYPPISEHEPNPGDPDPEENPPDPDLPPGTPPTP